MGQDIPNRYSELFSVQLGQNLIGHQANSELGKSLGFFNESIEYSVIEITDILETNEVHTIKASVRDVLHVHELKKSIDRDVFDMLSITTCTLDIEG